MLICLTAWDHKQRKTTTNKSWALDWPTKDITVGILEDFVGNTGSLHLFRRDGSWSENQRYEANYRGLYQRWSTPMFFGCYDILFSFFIWMTNDLTTIFNMNITSPILKMILSYGSRLAVLLIAGSEKLHQKQLRLFPAAFPLLLLDLLILGSVPKTK